MLCYRSSDLDMTRTLLSTTTNGTNAMTHTERMSVSPSAEDSRLRGEIRVQYWVSTVNNDANGAVRSESGIY